MSLGKINTIDKYIARLMRNGKNKGNTNYQYQHKEEGGYY